MEAMEAVASICTTCGHELQGFGGHHDGVEEFRLIGEYWTIRFEGRTCNLRDGKGLGYLAELLRAPGRQLHTLDLVALHHSDDECPHGECDDAYAALERARLSVTRAIRRAQARIVACHPSLGRHLDTTIRTGTYCAYVPDSRVPITWDVG